MTVFILLINFIEAFIFPTFLKRFFDIKVKKYIFFISGLIQFVILNIFSYFDISNYVLTLMIILINIFSLYSVEKIIIFEYVFITILYNFIILVTSYIGLYSTHYLLKHIISIPNDDYFFIYTCSIAKIILIFTTFLLLKYKNKYNADLSLSEWKPLLFMQLLLTISIVIVGYLIVDRYLENKVFIILSIMLVFSNFFYIYILNKIIHLYSYKLMYEKEEQLRFFNNEKMKIIKKIKNDISAIDHRLFYVVFEIDRLLHDNQISKALKLLESYKKIVLKQRMIINTQNEIFDTLMSLKINDLLMKEINIKTCMFITKNSFYDNLNFINFLVDLLEIVKESKEIELNLSEIFKFINVKMLFTESVDIEILVNFLKSNSSLIGNNYTLKHLVNNNYELKICLDLEDNLCALK